MTGNPTKMNPQEFTFSDWSGGSIKVLTIEKHALVCKENGSSKYWRAYVGTTKSSRASRLSWLVVLEWGKIGVGEGRREFKDFGGEFGATRYVRNRLKDKLQKGYVELESSSETEEISLPMIAAVTLDNSVSYEWDLF